MFIYIFSYHAFVEQLIYKILEPKLSCWCCWLWCSRWWCSGSAPQRGVPGFGAPRLQCCQLRCSRLWCSRLRCSWRVAASWECSTAEVLHSWGAPQLELSTRWDAPQLRCSIAEVLYGRSAPPMVSHSTAKYMRLTLNSAQPLREGSRHPEIFLPLLTLILPFFSIRTGQNR